MACEANVRKRRRQPVTDNTLSQDFHSTSVRKCKRGVEQDVDFYHADARYMRILSLKERYKRATPKHTSTRSDTRAKGTDDAAILTLASQQRWIAAMDETRMHIESPSATTAGNVALSCV